MHSYVTKTIYCLLFLIYRYDQYSINKIHIISPSKKKVRSYGRTLQSRTFLPSTGTYNQLDCHDDTEEKVILSFLSLYLLEDYKVSPFHCHWNVVYVINMRYSSSYKLFACSSCDKTWHVCLLRRWQQCSHISFLLTVYCDRSSFCVCLIITLSERVMGCFKGEWNTSASSMPILWLI